MRGLDTLLLNASGPLSDCEPEITGPLRLLGGSLTDELLRLLYQRNGFYAFESALHVFPSRSSELERGLDVWNANTLWRSDYTDLTDGCLFFAEDVFGGQFCLKHDAVFTFDPETGALEHLADDIEGWAKAIVSDYDVLTGFPLAHQWQVKHGRLPAAKRLIPKIPFVTGGKFALDNLFLADAVEGMKYRANIANQIRDIPDLTQITLKITEQS